MNLIERVIAWLAGQDVSAYLVGGLVRDRLLGRPNYDLDLAVDGDGLALARRLANAFDGDYYPLDTERGTGRAILYEQDGRRLVVDVARFRGPDLAADLADRDFTINALAADVRAPELIIDHHGGSADLAAGQVRAVSEDSIRNDPLRALRAVRQAAQLGFVLAPETEALLRRDGPAVAQVSAERQRDELARLLARPDAAPWLRYLDDVGLLTAVLPELEPLRGETQPPPHHLGVLAHSLAAVQALEALLAALLTPLPAVAEMERAGLAPLLPFAERIGAHLDERLGHGRPRLVSLKLATLLHDTGKPAARSEEQGRIRFLGHPQDSARITAEVMQRLRFNKPEVRLGMTVARHHMRPLLLAAQGSVSARAVYRFFRDTKDAGVDVVLHALADHRATFAPDVKDEEWPPLVALSARMLGDYWQRRQRVTPEPLVSGHDLLRTFDLEPGPHIGDLLEAVREAQVAGEVHTREQALALVRRRLDQP
ncbi:MAG: HD domain-containing protein [Anaerolineae bacterium]